MTRPGVPSHTAMGNSLSTTFWIKCCFCLCNLRCTNDSSHISARDQALRSIAADLPKKLNPKTAHHVGANGAREMTR